MKQVENLSVDCIAESKLNPRKLREKNASLAADATPDIEQDPFLQKLLQKRAELQRAIDAVDGVIALCRKEKPA